MTLRALVFAPGGATSAVTPPPDTTAALTTFVRLNLAAQGLAQRGAGAPPPDTAAVAQAYAQARNVAPLPDNRPLFQAMFTDRPQGALSPAVNSLWGGAQPSGRSSGLDDLCKDDCSSVPVMGPSCSAR